MIDAVAQAGVSADLASKVERCLPEDNAKGNVRMEGGAVPGLWPSSEALGQQEWLMLRVNGRKGGLAWAQEHLQRLFGTIHRRSPQDHRAPGSMRGLQCCGRRQGCRGDLEEHPNTRGIVMLGLDASVEELYQSLALAARRDWVRGLAPGRTIFGEMAGKWLSGDVFDADAAAEMSEKCKALCSVWDRTPAAKGEKTA